MKITGYRLRNTIQNLCHRRDALAAQFQNSLKKFPNEKKAHPNALMEEYLKCEEDIAQLQHAQTQYNMAAKATYNGKDVSLLFLIKFIGGLGRCEKMWRQALPKPDRYSYRDEDERSKENIYAESQMETKDILVSSRAAASLASGVREAIAVANATALHLDIDPALFD
jgi:hypothetical protein